METILSQSIKECGAKTKMLEISCSKTPVTKKSVIYSGEMNVRTSISIYSLQEINLAQIVSQVNLIKESAKPFIQFCFLYLCHTHNKTSDILFKDEFQLI